MKNTEKNLEQVSKLCYETPRMTSSEVELENGIANTSGDDSISTGFKRSETITEDVENNYWNGTN